MNPYLRSGDTQLDLSDLVKYLLHRVLWILLCGVICAGIAWAYQSHKVKKAEPETVPTIETETGEEDMFTPDELRTSMIDLSREGVLDLLSRKKEYLETSPYMQLDASHVWRANAFIHVESRSQEYPAYQIGELYRKNLGEGEYLEELAEKHGTSVPYLRELFSTWLVTAIDSSVPSGGKVLLKVEEDDSDNGISSEVICIQALGSTQEEAETLLDELLEEFQRLYETGKKDYPHEIQILSKTCSQALDTQVRDTQRNAHTYVQSLLNILTDFDNKTTLLAAAQEEAAAPDKKPMKPKKAGLIGLAAGLFLMCMWFTLRYIRNDNLVDYKDMNRNGIMLKDLGAVSGQNASMTAANIRNFAEEKKKLFLTGMAEQNEFAQACDSLKQSLSEYQIVHGRDMIHDPKSREALLACDAAVLVEQKGVTHYSDMKEEVNFLYNAGKEIIGVVIL